MVTIYKLFVSQEGRTPLHYCGSGPDPMHMWAILENAGADKDVVDRRGNKARNYMGIKPSSTGSTNTQGSNVATSVSSGGELCSLYQI